VQIRRTQPDAIEEYRVVADEFIFDESRAFDAELLDLVVRGDCVLLLPGPETFGIGVDYAVNIMQRARIEGVKSMHKVIVETGGAVVLCSMTTLLGYAALTLSINGAVRSFGLAGAVGEITALLAALVALPSVLLLRLRRPASVRAAESHVDDSAAWLR